MIDLEMIGAPSFSVAVVDGGFIYTAINGRLSEIIGIPKADFEGKVPHAILPRDYADTVVGQYRLCVDERRSVDLESFYDAPGGGRWWQTTVSPVFDDGEEGRVVRLIGVSVDVTSRKAAERCNREIDARISLAMDVLEGGFWHYSVAKAQFRTSPQLTLLLMGTAAAPLDFDGYRALALPEDGGALDFGALTRGEADIGQAEYRVRTPHGELRWLSCTRRLTRDDAGQPENVIGVVVDVTEQKLRQQHLAAQAATDSLTELNNRRGFEAMGHRLLKRARAEDGGLGLVLLDLDRFKPVNDLHGHAVGDTVLREVAARLQRHTRPGDVAARLGGDEFAVLVEDATEEVLSGVASRLVAAMARPIMTDAGRVDIGASVGIALWRPEDGDLAALAARADAALMAVKRDGRGDWRIAA